MSEMRNLCDQCGCTHWADECPKCKTIPRLQVQLTALAAIWAAFIEQAQDSGFWGAGDFDSEPLWDVARTVGLMEEVRYDPEIHGQLEEVEPGEIIWHLTAMGTALAAKAEALPSQKETA